MSFDLVFLPALHFTDKNLGLLIEGRLAQGKTATPGVAMGPKPKQVTCAESGVLSTKGRLFRGSVGSSRQLTRPPSLSDWFHSHSEERGLLHKAQPWQQPGKRPWQILLPSINSSLPYIVPSIVCTFPLVTGWVKSRPAPAADMAHWLSCVRRASTRGQAPRCIPLRRKDG